MLFEPFYMMIFTDRDGVQKYFDVAKLIEVVPNLELNSIASQLTRDDMDEHILRQLIRG